MITAVPPTDEQDSHRGKGHASSDEGCFFEEPRRLDRIEINPLGILVCHGALFYPVRLGCGFYARDLKATA